MNATLSFEQHRQAIREKIDRGIEQLDRGEGVDGEQVFAELEAELRRRETSAQDL